MLQHAALHIMRLRIPTVADRAAFDVADAGGSTACATAVLMPGHMRSVAWQGGAIDLYIAAVAISAISVRNVVVNTDARWQPISSLSRAVDGRLHVSAGERTDEQYRYKRP